MLYFLLHACLGGYFWRVLYCLLCCLLFNCKLWRINYLEWRREGAVFSQFCCLCSKALGSPGEIIVYPLSPIRHPSVRQPFSKTFSSKTALQIEVKFYVAPPWVGGTKVCSWHLGHMTMMAAMPIYGKNHPPKIFSAKLGM